MANFLNTDKQIAIIAALAETLSIRSIERTTARQTRDHTGIRANAKIEAEA